MLFCIVFYTVSIKTIFAWTGILDFCSQDMTNNKPELTPEASSYDEVTCTG